MANFREVQVVSVKFITPNMKRIVFHGNDLNDFPEGYEGGYVKLQFDLHAEPITDKTLLETLEKKQRIIRTYSVRAFDRQACTITIDFALHHDENGTISPAADWAKVASPGDKVVIGGPGSVIMADPEYDWFLFVGDMTGLPAISCNLERLPKNAKGYAVLEIADEADRQSLDMPENIEVVWLVNHTPGENSELLSTVQRLTWLEGKPFVWTACEFDNMKRLRKWYKFEKGVEKEDIYISSYWKFGHTEDQHKIVKRQDAKAQ